MKISFWQVLKGKSSSTINNKRNVKVILLMGIFFTSFLASMIWYEEFSWRGSFEKSHYTFKGSENTPDISIILNGEGKPLVVHFVDPACDCNRFSKEHLDHLDIVISQYVQKLTIYMDGSTSVPPINSKLEKQFQEWVPASPSTAVWNSDGELAYFGPYSSGVVCGSGTDLVLFTMKSLANGINPRWVNQEAVGCYCENSSFTSLQSSL